MGCQNDDVDEGCKQGYGERIIPEPLERDAIILDLHKYGHLGINRVADAIVTCATLLERDA